MRLPAARQSGPRPASHVLSSSRILLFTQLIPELVCDPISRHFILSCRFPGAPPVHYGMLRPQVPFSLPGAVAGGTRSPGYPPKGGGEGTRWGNAGPGRGPTGVPPCQGTPLPSLAAYDSWCGVAHGCTRKIGLKICGKSARGTPHPDLRHASDRAPLGHAPLRPGTGRTDLGLPLAGSRQLRTAPRVRSRVPGSGWDGRCPFAPPVASGVRGAGSERGSAASPSEIVQPYRSRKYGSPGEERLTRALLKGNPSACCAGKIALAASQRAGTWNAERETNAQSDRDVRAGDSFADNELSSRSGFLGGAFAFGDKQADLHF